MTYKTQIAGFALVAFVLFGSVMPAFASHDDHDDTDEASCWISANPDLVYERGTVVLTWGSRNADDAWIEDIGDVSTSGSRVVYVDEDTTFKLTVENERGTGSCETDVDVRGSGHTSSYEEPGCSIYREETWGGGAILRWSSSNASSAYISDVGTVPLWGSRSVSTAYDRTYTLTVYGNGKSESCEVWVSGTGSYQYPHSNYQYPNYQYGAQYPQYQQFSASYPYISLTQIPYTGIDFGSAGNALYWAALLAFALAGGYLLVYQTGVVRLSFAGEVKMAMRNQLRAIRSILS